MSRPFSCSICSGTSTLCYKCQVNKLTQEVHELREELTRLYAIKSDELKLKYYQLQDLQNIKQRNTPFHFEYESKLSNSYFCTITFDPNRFGVESQEEDRKNYILYHLYNLMTKLHYITELYGSFEYHKNGIIHAHTIIVTGYPEDVKKYLKSQFTNNPNNRVAIQLDKAKYPQAKEYIDKESNHYFYYKVKNIESGTERLERCQRRLVTDEGRERDVECVRHLIYNGEEQLDYNLYLHNAPYEFRQKWYKKHLKK